MLIGDGAGGLQDARSSGFRAVLREARIETDAAAVLQIRDSIDSGYAACMRLMTNAPRLTAIFATNDLLAIGALQALMSQGQRVPNDVSVIGITDIQLCHQVHPALTTVTIHTDAVAELSVDSLIRLIDTPGQPPPMVLAPPPHLVVRASTGPLRRPDQA
jgi:DNA-binding LacI/PurR family transcriptional regulator